jgi:hypothetical protein
MIPAIPTNIPLPDEGAAIARVRPFTVLVENTDQWHFIAFPPVALFSFAVYRAHQLFGFAHC